VLTINLLISRCSSTRAITYNRSESRFRYFITSGSTGSIRLSATTWRSARRTIVRAMSRAAEAWEPPGRTKKPVTRDSSSKPSIARSSRTTWVSLTGMTGGSTPAGVASSVITCISSPWISRISEKRSSECVVARARPSAELASSMVPYACTRGLSFPTIPRPTSFVWPLSPNRV